MAEKIKDSEDYSSYIKIDKTNQNSDGEIDYNQSRSSLISHNIIVNGRRKSVRLEKEMWLGLKEIARREGCSVHDLCGVIESRKRENTSLTAAIRVFTMVYYQSAATEQGHYEAGHGQGADIAGEIITRNEATPYYGLRDFKHLPPDQLQ